MGNHINVKKSTHTSYQVKLKQSTLNSVVVYNFSGSKKVNWHYVQNID